MRTKPMQLSVFAVAALAIVAAAAITLLSGGAPAQATTAFHAPDGGGHLWPEQGGPGGPGGPTPEPTEKPTPQQTVPEDCLTPAASVISSGHYALFEAYWDAEDKNLVNNPCPPSVTHGEGAHDTDARSASNSNIGSTIFHVPGDAEGSRLYTVESAYRDSGGNSQGLQSNSVVVNWQ